METTFRIRPDELTPDFLNKIKALFKNEKALEIVISPASDAGLTQKESRKAYMHRVNKAIENLEANRDTVTFSKEEFDNLTSDLLNNK